MPSSRDDYPKHPGPGVLTHRLAMELSLPRAPDATLRMRIADHLVRLDGVSHAAYSELTPDVIVVEFDPGTTTAQTLHDQVSALCPVRRKVLF